MQKLILIALILLACGTAFASDFYQVLDTYADGENAVTTVDFYAITGNGKANPAQKVTLEVVHYKPESVDEIFANLDEMVLTSQPPKPKDNEQQAITAEVVSELKQKIKG